MSTTITVDDDVAALLEQETRRTGLPVAETANRVLRCGLQPPPSSATPEPFVIKTRKLGLPAEWTSGCVAELIEILEGPLHR